MKSNIKRLLDNRNLTWRDLSHLTGIPYRTLFKYQAKTIAGMPLYRVLAITRALNCTVEDLITEKE
ncbi:MAG: helix-turn-helix transcriptional regulator [Atopobium sp.]|uniref:helix-turn-helix domain-containing protein n=1 Tax=Atopobium sp. TaxID=1872650 RepID=UPI002A83C2F8|nr:helix-turn-helix transcriptional regulator [Atopobium sp.]MDY4522752.1 helix-turn-helix transcriptional regulator [Atopobium sp.]